jgi:hypothetical protein
MLSSIKSRLGLGEPAPQTLLPQSLLQSATAALDEHTTLTWRHRAIGFGLCAGIGLLLSFLSLFCLWTLQFKSFAVLYSFGAVLSLGR